MTYTAELASENDENQNHLAEKETENLLVSPKNKEQVARMQAGKARQVLSNEQIYDERLYRTLNWLYLNKKSNKAILEDVADASRYGFVNSLEKKGYIEFTPFKNPTKQLGSHFATLTPLGLSLVENRRLESSGSSSKLFEYKEVEPKERKYLINYKKFAHDFLNQRIILNQKRNQPRLGNFWPEQIYNQDDVSEYAEDKDKSRYMSEIKSGRKYPDVVFEFEDEDINGMKYVKKLATEIEHEPKYGEELQWFVGKIFYALHKVLTNKNIHKFKSGLDDNYFEWQILVGDQKTADRYKEEFFSVGKKCLYINSKNEGKSFKLDQKAVNFLKEHVDIRVSKEIVLARSKVFAGDLDKNLKKAKELDAILEKLHMNIKDFKALTLDPASQVKLKILKAKAEKEGV